LGFVEELAVVQVAHLPVHSAHYLREHPPPRKPQKASSEEALVRAPSINLPAAVLALVPALVRVLARLCLQCSLGTQQSPISMLLRRPWHLQRHARLKI